jgi:hypothetical protein
MMHTTPESALAEAKALVETLKNRGSCLENAGGKLVFSPASCLTEADCEAIRRLKRYVLDTLQKNGINGTTAQETGRLSNTARAATLAPWDAAESGALIDQVQARRRQLYGPSKWPSDPDARRRLGPLMGGDRRRLATTQHAQAAGGDGGVSGGPRRGRGG